MESIANLPRMHFESPTIPPQPPSTHVRATDADASEVTCSCRWNFRPKKTGDAAWNRHIATVTADFADWDYADKVAAMIGNVFAQIKAGAAHRNAGLLLWKLYYESCLRWRREFSSEGPRTYLKTKAFETLSLLLPLNIRFSIAELFQIREFLPYDDEGVLRRMSLRAQFPPFRIIASDNPGTISAQLQAGEADNAGIPIYIAMNGVKDMPPFPTNVTAQSELAAVKKEHQSIILRDASTARELEKQLFELECLHERLERLQIMPGISAENDDAITYYIDLIATDANGLEGEILEQVQKEENGHRHTDESGGGGRTRTAPVRAAARPITAALNDSLPESPQKPKRRAGKPKNDVPAEKLTPKKRAKKAAAVPAVAKPAAAQGLRESPYETKAPPLSALPAALPARVPVPKNPAEMPRQPVLDDDVPPPSPYAARGVLFYRGASPALYHHLTGYAALFAVLFKHSSITAENPLRAGLEESMRMWRLDLNSPEELLRAIYSIPEPPVTGAIARPNGQPFRLLRGKAALEEVVTELLRRLPVALLHAVFDLLSNSSLLPFFSLWDPLVQEYAEYLHVRLWSELRFLMKPCYHVYARIQVETAMRLIQQGHDVGLVLFQEHKPARVASYECTGDLRRAQAWSKQCEACELLGRHLAAAANGLAAAGEQQFR